MTPSQIVVLLLAATLGGALNSVVGGGSFVVFPALMLSGVAAVSANATTSLVLLPAAIASTAAYRKDMKQSRLLLVLFSAASLLGGILGAVLLLRTSNTTFVRLVPWLLLFGTVLFSVGGVVRAKLAGRPAPEARGELAGTALIVGAGLQLLIAIYGGYFGGGMGIMMLAAYSLLGMTDIHGMNGLRTLCGTVLNGVAVVAFIAAHAISWKPGLLMMASATVAGYVGATVARKVDPKHVRRLVMCVAWAMTIYFFVRAYAL